MPSEKRRAGPEATTPCLVCGVLWEDIGQLKDVEVRADAKLWLEWAPWDIFLRNSDEILKAMVLKGRVTPSQAETYSADEEAWLKELRSIWEEVSVAANNEEL